MNIKQSLLSQGNIQTLEQLGVVNENEREVFTANLTTTTTGVGHKTRATYVRYDYVPVFGGRREMEKNYLITSVAEEFIQARAANTSLAKYEPTDVAKWLMASDGINTLVAEIKRYFKSNFMGANSERNQVAAGQITVVSRFTGGTVNGSDDLANLISRYNRIAGKLNGIRVPKGVPMIDYHFNLSSKVYNEDETLKSPHYFFRAVSVPFWDVNGIYGEVGAVRWLNLSTTTQTESYNDINRMLDVLQLMADVYTTDNIANNMFSEFQKANMDSVYELTTYDPLDYSSIKFETNMLQMMAVKNARIVNLGRMAMQNNTLGLYVVQGTSPDSGAACLKYKTVIGSTTYANQIVSDQVDENDYSGSGDYHPGMDYGTSQQGQFSALVNFHKDNNTPNDVFDALQFRPTIKANTSAETFEVYSAGLAILVGMQICSAGYNNSVAQSQPIYCNILTTEETEHDKFLKRLCFSNEKATKQYTMFQCVPNFLIATIVGTQPTAATSIYVWDADNLITIGMSVVENLNSVIIQSGVTYNK